MRNSKSRLLFCLLLTIASSHAFAECDNLPAAPIIPDGNVASMDELVAAQKTIKIYQASLEEHRTCLTGLQSKIDPESETAAAESAALTERYNKTVDEETKMAEEFNNSVRAYKARQPES